MHLTFPIRGQKLSMSVEVREHLAHRVSPFQTIDVYDTLAFGKVLYLDGHVQLAELDEFAYHEALVHTLLSNIDGPKRALVIGGGDGGVLRELVKCPSLDQIHMVEIDQEVIDVCREFLPGVSAEAFDDPRVTVFVQDAFPFVKQAEGPYDLIVMDSTDVYEEEEGGLSEQLWTEAFYRDLGALLSDRGFLVTQADNLVFCPYSLRGILETFSDLKAEDGRALFPKTGSYYALVPSFGGFSGYAWASKGAEPAPQFAPGNIAFRYLNATTYRLGMDGIPFTTE